MVDWGVWSTPSPDHFTLWNVPWYPLYRRLGGTQAGLDEFEKSQGPFGVRKPNYYNSLRLIRELKTMYTKILAKISFSWLGVLSKKVEELLQNDFVEILISVTVHSII